MAGYYKYIGKCSLCSKNLPYMAMYPKNYLEIPQVPIGVLAIDTIGCLPVMSKGKRWALTAICSHSSYVFTNLMKEKSAQNVFQTYLSGILAHKGKV